MGIQLLLVNAHIFLICLSNILVQHPLSLFHVHTTWGAFSYPLIFILTDLTTRLLGPVQARTIIFQAMLPGLVVSFLLANWFSFGHIWVNNLYALRIALASFSAYVLGQLVDILFFQKFRQYASWWVAPTFATIFGNVLDTYCFFSVAFYHSSDSFMSSHWLEIATVDLLFKLGISLVSFVPLYGLLLSIFIKKRNRKTQKIMSTETL